jgi:hypothetical protein
MKKVMKDETAIKMGRLINELVESHEDINKFEWATGLLSYYIFMCETAKLPFEDFKKAIEEVVKSVEPHYRKKVK